MSLLQVLACPRCRTAVERVADALVCAQCKRRFRLEKGVPVMLLEDGPVGIQHEGELTVFEGYFAGVQRLIESLAPDQIMLDIGAGNRTVVDPRVIRMDVVWTPYVDVIGDAHALPFRADAFEFVLASAVWEHLTQPFVAAQETWRVLKPGGQIAVDCNFVFPFHGFPAVYFNASKEGLRQLFKDFAEIAVEVAPWQMPSFAIEALLKHYMHHFQPQTPVDHEFVQLMQRLEQFDLRALDARMSQEVAARMAAGVSFLGLKQPHGNDTVVPKLVLDLYRREPALQQRFANPATLLPTLLGPSDTLLHWARTEGSAQHPEIAAWFASRVPFAK